MENLNAEQVKKALGDCMLGDCEPCAYRGCVDCRDSMCFDALALINSQEQRIKELAEENEYLKQQNEIYAVLNEKMERICESYAFQYGTAVPKEVFLKKEREKAVKEMQERLKDEMRNTAKYSFGGREYSVIGEAFIDQIAKEMLEGVCENTTN